MMRALFKRLAIALGTLLAISFVIFTILSLAPGDPLSEFANNPAITAEVRENIRRSLGLDQPFYIRYVKWLWALCQGNLGYSFTSKSPVLGLIWQRLPTTLWVVGLAYGLSVAIALPLGIISALRRNSLLDQLATTFAFLGYSLPTFFTGLLAIIVFSVKLQWLPSLYNSTLVVNDFQSFWQQIQQSILPITVLALYQTAILTRFVRNAILEELPQDYVRTAYAKGLGEFAVLRKHILRNALIPVVTLIAIDVPSIVTGALVTEQIFRVPGIGALLIESINRNDTPVIMGITIVYAALVVIFNAIADLSYRLLDPRIK
ncbi:ABC transporter substrate-binding protein [Picosynechococcus sp. PCC 7003]|uniref:ABC transporter permease n=1 Tax=Picosynechococcus sp. PCC 7003 TaxID=374981 RepID=UPI000810DFA2|nr:ABC transporter permease [Picosynechococcus sp. PCC 7003]ANV85515.1 ABC transporter substrate-binding protein [Picosynechococcus sp. PCC 7003]